MFECDYYTNPTILSQCIRMEDYAAASRRLAKHPEEARVFVCRRIHLPAAPPRQSRTDVKVAVYQPTAERQVVTTSRTLPIHMVLHQPALPAQRKERNQLLSELITAYPESCRMRCGEKHRYILEFLLAERSTTQLVSLALAAYPSAIEKIDETISMPRRLRQLLQRGVDFWERVRIYANISNDHQSSVGNISLKSNGIQEYKTLEQRCLTLERLLLSANAENYELQQEIEAKDRVIASLRAKLGDKPKVSHPIPPPEVVRPPKGQIMAPASSMPRRQDCSNTIVSGLTDERSRFLSRASSTNIRETTVGRPSEGNGEDTGAYSDDDDTTALLESICRPMSPLEDLPVEPKDSTNVVPKQESTLPPRPPRSHPRQEDCTSTVVSSLSVDQSRFPYRKSSSVDTSNNDGIQGSGKNASLRGNGSDDEDTEALMEFICRPMSPFDSQGSFVAMEKSHTAMPDLEETETSADEEDDAITSDTVLKEPEVEWTGRRLSPKFVSARKQFPVPPRMPKKLPTMRRSIS